MVRVLSHLLPFLAISLQVLASNVQHINTDLTVRNLETKVDHAVDAVLSINVDVETSASAIVGLGKHRVGIDVEVGRKGVHVGVGWGVKGRVGLSMDVCVKALLGNLELTLDGNTACTGPSDITKPFANDGILECSCSDPTVSLVMVIPQENLNMKASIDLIAMQEYHFEFTKDGKKHAITVSNPTKEWRQPKKLHLAYLNMFQV